MPVVNERSRVRGLFSFCLLLPAKRREAAKWSSDRAVSVGSSSMNGWKGMLPVRGSIFKTSGKETGVAS